MVADNCKTAKWKKRTASNAYAVTMYPNRTGLLFFLLGAFLADTCHVDDLRRSSTFLFPLISNAKDLYLPSFSFAHFIPGGLIAAP